MSKSPPLDFIDRVNCHGEVPSKSMWHAEQRRMKSSDNLIDTSISLTGPRCFHFRCLVELPLPLTGLEAELGSSSSPSNERTSKSVEEKETTTTSYFLGNISKSMRIGGMTVSGRRSSVEHGFSSRLVSRHCSCPDENVSLRVPKGAC